jgi:hypothetical protein
MPLPGLQIFAPPAEADSRVVSSEDSASARMSLRWPPCSRRARSSKASGLTSTIWVGAGSGSGAGSGLGAAPGAAAPRQGRLPDHCCPMLPPTSPHPQPPGALTSTLLSASPSATCATQPLRRTSAGANAKLLTLCLLTTISIGASSSLAASAATPSSSSSSSLPPSSWPRAAPALAPADALAAFATAFSALRFLRRFIFLRASSSPLTEKISRLFPATRHPSSAPAPS